MNSMIRHPGCVIVAALFSVMCLCMAPRDSIAHAYPDHADPKVGSTVSAAPSLVRIWFDGDLEPVFSSIMVHAAKDNTMVDKGDGRVDPSDPTLLEVSVPPLPQGSYIVMWSVVARDGHRTSGNFMFTIK
jgi:methionine-rich copper-binding protein CopC